MCVSSVPESQSSVRFALWPAVVKLQEMLFETYTPILPHVNENEKQIQNLKFHNS